MNSAILNLRFSAIPLGRMALLLSILAVTGCGTGDTGPETYSVTGDVTFDGEPIENGSILFRKVEGDQKAFAGQIANGKYELQAEPGKMNVEITASRLIPGKFDTSNDEPEPMGEMYIPANYNAESTLSAEVKAADENKIPFNLESGASE